jgi:hypothetical protein
LVASGSADDAGAAEFRERFRVTREDATMAKKSALHIVTANHLLDGDSIYLGDGGWTTDHRSARVANGADEAAALEAAGRVDEDGNKVVGVYLVAVEFDQDGQAQPVHFREKMRVLARPSFWPSPVKAAKSGRAVADAESRHVSL